LRSHLVPNLSHGSSTSPPSSASATRVFPILSDMLE
jgi:hypothetical protein